ncbi:MAG TPA: hypothetical protein VIW28_13795 [Gemmatimonadales bacterium]|jgi:hypothetical protein
MIRRSVDSSLKFRALVVAAAVVPMVAGVIGCAGAQDRKTNGKSPEPKFAAFDAGSFDSSTRIDNPWMPLKPGTRFVYDGTTIDDDGTAIPHRIVVHVTDLTKVIGGIRTLVTWDLDYKKGELVEAELAFYAQDRNGTVWYFGEYPEEYEDGKFVAARPWIHGFENARAGIMMVPEPKIGTPSYSEGWGPAVEWTDRGQVDQVGQKTCVREGCHTDVLVIAESNAEEADAQQLKYYARGVGNVRVGWRGAGEKTKETLELARVDQVDASALAEVRARALELERSAYRRSTAVYAHTPPAERTPGADGQGGLPR